MLYWQWKLISGRYSEHLRLEQAITYDMEEYKSNFPLYPVWCPTLWTCCLLMYMAGCGYIPTCKHIHVQRGTERDQAPQPVPELPSLWHVKGQRERKKVPLDGFPGKGMIWEVNLLILSELKSHELWCFDPVLSAGTRDSSMILAVELWPGIHFCLGLPCPP